MPAASYFFVNRSGLRLHYLRHGQGTGVPVVLLHGLRAYAQTWDSLVAALGDGFDCVALDQRGRGCSDWAESDSYRTEVYVQDVEDLANHLGFDNFVLIGHSLGGANALEYVRGNPGRVRALVIEDIGPGSSSTGDGAARIRREMSETPLVFKDWAAAEQFWRTSRPGLSTEGLASRLSHSMRAVPEGVVWRHDQQGIAQARLSIQPTDLWPAVLALDCPTLFIRGGRSDFLPAAMLEEMRKRNAHVNTVVVPDASHYVHDDQNDIFNREVLTFLKRQDLSQKQ
ncbi:alpha/beta hydrolase [Pseudomonas juntendi]|uniref:Alpha/beta hydrolase n=1 Tax=Pseudomonas juntendi TaxID=2666183 RepID=A0ABD4YA11_9PSED|nr:MULTISPECIES: alpha/beta hydrolase [Pseudomonas]MDH0756180.1 alpha/beta hydrolase [Pseudomonas juntendi]MDH1919864.1 alpha/beta hydrolase [Pseudomonas juntendi]RRV65061.1 alpha/beta hydrolase [Pseudomonas sp. p99-361]SUD79727.1 putative hydrolase [Pseudomonas putida]